MTAKGHPRPLLQRDNWVSLDGRWSFAYDDQAAWERPEDVTFSRDIIVPYPPESSASGIGDTGPHPVLWYTRVVEVPELSPGERLLLHFGAVDYRATVWVNNELVASHEGGHTPFTADVTTATRGRATLDVVVRAHDDPRDLAQPRGKQDWRDEPHVIWHYRTSGIWQTVWLEVVPSVFVTDLRWTANIDRWEIDLDIRLNRMPSPGSRVHVSLRDGGQVIAEQVVLAHGLTTSCRLALPDPGIEDERQNLLWSPEHPCLIEATVNLDLEGSVIDSVKSYTAMRSVGTAGRHFSLNGRPYYLRLVLDQGYWPDTLLAADDARLRRDVELVRAFGFNGVRVHQKIADPRYLYWCDVIGVLVWPDMPAHYSFTPEAVGRLMTEWREVIERDRSHPCVMAWVPFNESWGLPDLPHSAPQRAYARAAYELTKALDPTRPAIANDGWEYVTGDWVGVHDYAVDRETLSARYGTPERCAQTIREAQPGDHLLALDGCDTTNLPVVFSEFGALADSSNDVVSLDRIYHSPEELISNYSSLMRAVHDCTSFAGYCYTQLTDTFYERNGLATADRVPKADPRQLAAASQGPWAAREAGIDTNPDQLGYSLRWRRTLGSKDLDRDPRRNDNG